MSERKLVQGCFLIRNTTVHSETHTTILLHCIRNQTQTALDDKYINAIYCSNKIITRNLE